MRDRNPGFYSFVSGLCPFRPLPLYQPTHSLYLFTSLSQRSQPSPLPGELEYTVMSPLCKCKGMSTKKKSYLFQHNRSSFQSNCKYPHPLQRSITWSLVFLQHIKLTFHLQAQKPTEQSSESGTQSPSTLAEPTEYQ